MIAPEDPPGFVVRTEAQKAAWDNGFRLEQDVEHGWVHYTSTTAPGSVWIAGASQRGPWLLSINHLGASTELGGPTATSIAGPGIATFMRGSGGSPCEGRERGGRPPREAGVAPPRFPYLGTTSLERSTRPAGGYPFWETPDPRSGPTQEKSRALRDAEQGTCQRRGSNLSKPPGVNGRQFASWGL
jgi:hypothetical protein